MLKYVAPFLVSTSLACATNTASKPVENQNLEQKVAAKTELETMEREVANGFLMVVEYLFKNKLIECTEIKANKKYTCRPTISIKSVLEDNTILDLRRINYNKVNGDSDSVDVFLVPSGYPQHLENGKVVKNFELRYRIDAKDNRVLYIEVKEEVLDARLPREKERSINTTCYNILNQELAKNAQEECIYE